MYLEVRGVGSPGLELLAIVSQMKWVLGLELQSSEPAASTLNR